jgi:transposase
MPGQRKYSDEFKQRAVRLVFEWREENDNPRGGATAVAEQLGIGAETLRNWVKKQEIERGERAGLTADEREELKELRKRNFELERANEILKSAASFFARELDRPHGR